MHGRCPRTAPGLRRGADADSKVGLVDRLARFDHVRFRNGNDKAPAGGTIGRLLAQYLSGEIPDQQQDEVRSSLEQPIGMDDRNPR